MGAGDAIPKPRVCYLSVTHPFATNHSPDYSIKWSVRLACLSHAASVRSEPGSNPSVCIVESAFAKAAADKSAPAQGNGKQVRFAEATAEIVKRLNTSANAPKVLKNLLL